MVLQLGKGQGRRRALRRSLVNASGRARIRGPRRTVCAAPVPSHRPVRKNGGAAPTIPGARGVVGDTPTQRQAAEAAANLGEALPLGPRNGGGTYPISASAEA